MHFQKMKIVADRDIPFLQGVLEPFAEVVYLPGDQITAADVLDADALLVRTRTRCDAALLGGDAAGGEAARVRFIGTATIGFDHIDMAFCAARGITVATAAGSNARGVLQWVAAALAWLASGQGAPGGFEPARTTLGVVGVGNVGSLVAHYAAEWGFRVMCSDPPREMAEGLGEADGFYPLPTLAAECDIISLHVPLDATTRHLVDSRFVEALKPGAVLINSSRGAVVDDGALNGRRYIMDVWNGEPDISRTILRGALLGTPHIAGYTRHGKATATAMIVGALADEFGLPLKNWFPPGAHRSIPRAISWAEMCATMPSHFDIAAESALLKAAPERFEAMRGAYLYREEYF